MNLQEAYKILEIPPTSTSEEAKKQYRKLSKKMHPDVNKEPDAEAKFKKINEAFQVVSTGKSTDREDLNWQQASNHQYNPFGANPFAQQRSFNVQNIITKIVISFVESVLGCEKEIKFNRNSKCSSCNGAGATVINNGCAACGGKGQVIRQQGGMIFIQTCGKCGGQTQKSKCIPCQSKGIVEAEASARVNIPGGIIDGNILNLQGLGHYIGSLGPMEQHANVHLHIKVIPEPGLFIMGTDVVTTLELSLQEALQGCKKIVNTINGYKDIEVIPKTRNKDEFIIPNMGVSLKGNQRVIIDVKYPDDISSLIEVLNNPNYKVN
jgi:molecular chaperone DnaJ